MRDVWVDIFLEYPVVELGRGGIYSYRTFEYAVKISDEYVSSHNLSQSVSEFKKDGGWLFKLKHYDYEVGDVLGVRQSENAGAECDADVEYNYKFTNKAPWTNAYFTQVKEYSASYTETTYTACFQKFDDGWRIKKKSE